MPITSIVSINQLITWFEDFQENHYFLKDFGFGEPYDIGTSVQMEFPYMWVTLNEDSSIATGSNVKSAIPDISFSVMFMDKINDQPNYLDTNGFQSDNSQEILSDTLQCLQDLITMIQQNWGQYGVLISQDVSFYPAIDETQDKATGIVARIVLRTRQVNCVIPESPNTIVVQPNQPTYATLLTCENLIDCATFQTYAYTGGTYNSGTTELTITSINGHSFSISGITGGGGGASGTSGSSGVSGSSGTSGDNGTSGTSGVSGANGTSGTSGVSGTSGTSGSSGVNGTSGTSGTSGSSGLQGGTLFSYSTNTSAGDPSPGFFRFNVGKTKLYISNEAQGLNTGNFSVDNWIASWDDSTTTTNRGTLTIQSADPYDNTILILDVTGSSVDNVTWWEVNVNPLDISSISNNELCVISFSRTGNAGQTGTSGTSGISGTSGTSGLSGTSGTSGQSGLSNSFFNYQAKTTITTGDPASGHLIWNSATQSGATQINISETDLLNNNIDIFLSNLVSGSTITIQDQADHTNYQTWIIGAPIDNTTYWSLPVTLVTSTYSFSNNQDVLFIITTVPSGTSGTSGISGTSGTSGQNGTSGSSGESGTSGTSGPAGATGTSGTSGDSGTSGTSGTGFSSPFIGNVQVTSGQTWVTLPSTGTTTANTTIDWNNGNVQHITLGVATTTFTFSNPQAGATYILVVRQQAGGSGTIVWPGTVAWSGAATPVMTATANRYDVYTFVYDGVKFYGSYVQNFT